MISPTQIRRLMQSLRVSGWRHTTRWHQEGCSCGCDGDLLRVHEWTRGNEVIKAWMDSPTTLSGHVLYEAEVGRDDASVTLDVGWLRQHGIAGLLRLAKALGVVTTDPYPFDTSWVAQAAAGLDLNDGDRPVRRGYGGDDARWLL